LAALSSCCGGMASAEEMSESLLSSFFPARGQPLDNGYAAHARRCLLVAPNGSGRSSLLFQHALCRASRGQSTLYMFCGPREQLTPARPTLMADHDEADADNAQLRKEEQKRLLRLIHIKYVETWEQLRDVLRDMHLTEARPMGADSLPAALILDGLDALISMNLANADQGPPATPSPSKPIVQAALMQMALGLALASHAADLLDAVHSPGVASTVATHQKTMLIVACTAPGPEAELASRWLSTFLRVTPLSAPRSGLPLQKLFRLRACRSALDAELACVHYTFDGRMLQLVTETLSPSRRDGARSPLGHGLGTSQHMLWRDWTPAGDSGCARRRLSASDSGVTPA